MTLRQLFSAIALIILMLPPAEGGAADPAAICQADRSATLGKLVKCGAGVVSKAVASFETPDADRLARCAEKFVAQFARIEAAANGACLPAVPDAAAVSAAMQVCSDPVIVSLGGPAGAGNSTDKCQSQKIKTAGKYMDCRFKADSKAHKKAVLPEFSRCDAKFNARFAKLELKGPCSTTGDAATVRADLTECFQSAPGQVERVIVARDATRIVLDEERTASALGLTWELDFYRNPAYSCGKSGKYSFLVINPAGNPDGEAPLWAYLHGGGIGYYDATSTYVAVKDQTENTWNHEETFDDLWEKAVLANAFNQSTGQPIDSTLKRRIEEGYRVVAVSMCDHDGYSGLGTPYTNNPHSPDAEVNGLQATMAAIDFTVANYPTTHVWTHGTSAGSIGVWSLAASYTNEGTPLTGIVADSWIATPRLNIIAEAFAGEPGYPFGAEMTVQGVSDKVGFFARDDIRAWPEAQVPDRDFRAVPSLFVNGNDDPFCGGNQAPLAEAVADGLTNCQWFHDALRQEIDAQPNSPHQYVNLLGYGHVPTNRGGPANDFVDDFVAGVLATNPPNFGAR